MKKVILILLLAVICGVIALSNLFVFAPRFDSERIAGFKFPEGSELVFRKRDSAYKIYKWRIPKEHFATIRGPSDLSNSSVDGFKWSKRDHIDFSDGADRLLDKDDVPPGSSSINYQTSHHAVELIKSPSESTITIIGIYNN